MAGVSAMAVVTTSDGGDDGNGGAVGGDVDSGGGGGIASSGIAKAGEKIEARVAHTNTAHAKMLNRRSCCRRARMSVAFSAVDDHREVQRAATRAASFERSVRPAFEKDLYICDNIITPIWSPQSPLYFLGVTLHITFRMSRKKRNASSFLCHVGKVTSEVTPRYKR